MEHRPPPLSSRELLRPRKNFLRAIKASPAIPLIATGEPACLAGEQAFARQGVELAVREGGNPIGPFAISKLPLLSKCFQDLAGLENLCVVLVSRECLVVGVGTNNTPPPVQTAGVVGKQTGSVRDDTQA